jgi:hypothetical protein
MARYLPDIARQGRAVRKRLRALVPGAVEMVYDNYNGLVMGFSPTERPSDAVLSILLQPEWVTLCFLKGAKLPDPKQVLRGAGSQVRHVRLASPEDLDRPELAALMERVVTTTEPPFAAKGMGATIIRSVSIKQRPRRPRS